MNKMSRIATLIDTEASVKDEAITDTLHDLANYSVILKIYLENSVGIGEHPQHIDEVDKLIEKIANAEEKLIVLQQFKL